MKKIIFMLCLLMGSLGFSQNPYTINFQDETIEIPENISTFDWNEMPDYSRLNGGYYGWVQFYQTPTQSVQDDFKNRGLQLINYIPHQTYLFFFPEAVSSSFLIDSGVRGIVPVEARFKMEKNLKNGDIGEWAWDGDNILVNLVHQDNINRQYVLNELASHQILVKKTYDASNILELSIPTNCLEDLAKSPYVKWVEVINAPPVLDDERGRALHRANWLESVIPTGLDYTGRGVGVLCRDDGAVGPHIDFQGRIFGLSGNNGNNNHGDGVSGIMAGAGNRNPNIAGMARGANLFVTNYFFSFIDSGTVSLINSGDVQITNSSFSDGCNVGYTLNAQTTDGQIVDNESLIHVFSAGNSNNNNCGYGAGNQWGNITGGHKQGKNSIATASTRYDGALSDFSSRGPAHDGRIKPDIAANGEGQLSTQRNHEYQTFGGTSAAAPGIAGISAQLYELYMDQNGGVMPNSGLIKAALLNTANEAGNVGPDFRFGWGIVNGKRAGELLLEDRFLSDEVTQGNTNTHTINVPSGTTQVRFMVYWKDPAATPGANPALVNDLDMVVSDPSNNDLLPWVLDETPNPTTLNNPAVPGIDRLNNMEQVLINNPAAGNYDIEITGFNVPVGPQEYFVVYEVIQDNLTVIYPNGGEKIFTSTTIHWDAVNTTEPFTIDISTDGGATWDNLGTADADETNIDWVPANDVHTGEALIRITSGSFSDVSDVNFTITRNDIDNNMTVLQVCEDEATFEWQAYPEADGYEFYILGENYMELVGSSDTNSITIPLVDYDPAEDEIWYAVAPKNDAEGWVGQRNIAQVWDDGLFNCAPLNTEDFELGQNIQMYPNPASDILNIEVFNTLQNISSVSIINSLGQVITTLNNNTSSSKMNVNVSNLTTGLYFVTITTDSASVTKKLLVK